MVLIEPWSRAAGGRLAPGDDPIPPGRDVCGDLFPDAVLFLLGLGSPGLPSGDGRARPLPERDVE